jgi:hypothetical protein
MLSKKGKGCEFGVVDASIEVAMVCTISALSQSF